MNSTKIGKFIVFEGLDRSGKSTQSKLLVDYLKKENINVKSLNLPNRETPIGNIITKYLKMEKHNMSNETIHLLFSANRWEQINEIKNLLFKGVWIVCDRYAYSGVAYSVGALNLTKTWCMNPDQGLIKPDIVFYMDLPPNCAQNRSEYGEEIYEKIEIQKKIYEAYRHFANDDYWISVDATKDIDEIHNFIIKEIKELQKQKNASFKYLWS